MTVLALLLLVGAQEVAGYSATVGMPVSVHDLVLPGGELEAVPVDPAAPLVLRVDAVRPHGDRFRYDLVFYALEPGDYDLGAALRRRDGADAAELPPLAFHVTTLLPPGQVEPHRPGAGVLPRVGGYRLTLWLAGGAWVIGLFLLLSARRRAHARAAAPPARAATLAERVQGLVAAARAGELGPEGRAELERALIAWWQRRLGLERRSADETLAELALHPEAGPLLRGLEEWLHRPDAPAVDVDALLAPYRDLAREPVALPDVAPALGEAR